MFKIDVDKPDRAWLEEAMDRFSDANAARLLQTRAVLARVIGDSGMHARLINSLSMLEHMGSRKIMATQHSSGIKQSTLRHVAEEAHHAYFMRRQAEKAAGRPMGYTSNDLLAPAAARMYFQRLEAVILRSLEGQRSAEATYLYMSMIVEFRAMWFYALYQQALKAASHAMSLKRILGEEQNHLNEMAQRLESAGELSDARVDEFLQAESRLYGRLLDAIQRSIKSETCSSL